MSARWGKAASVVGYAWCLASAVSGVWLVVRCLQDQGYAPPLSTPGLLAISWVCALLVLQLGAVLRDDAHGGTACERRGR